MRLTEYSVDDPPGLGSDAVQGMSWALAEAAQAGDWGLVDSLQNAIYAMKGSKGRKGFGKGKPGKGGAAPAAAAKGGGTEFQGLCNHCGNWGHRLSECRKLSAELGKTGGKGGPKGKAGGKSGATGGKGPVTAPAPLAEVAAADGWAGDMLDGAIAEQAAEFDEWNFNTGICSVTAAPLDCAAGASASTRLAQTKTFYGARAVQPFSGETFADRTLSGKTADASASIRLA